MSPKTVWRWIWIIPQSGLLALFFLALLIGEGKEEVIRTMKQLEIWE